MEEKEYDEIKPNLGVLKSFYLVFTYIYKILPSIIGRIEDSLGIPHERSELQNRKRRSKS